MIVSDFNTLYHIRTFNTSKVSAQTDDIMSYLTSVTAPKVARKSKQVAELV
jgi:hypothetical protein